MEVLECWLNCSLGLTWLNYTKVLTCSDKHVKGEYILEPYCTVSAVHLLKVVKGLTLTLTSWRFYLILMSWGLYMTLTPLSSHWFMDAKWKTIPSSSKNWIIEHFMLPFRLQTSYRIFKNLLGNISRQFWQYFFSRPILSWENPSRKYWHCSKRFYSVRNRFLPWWNLSDQCCYFLDGFSQLRMGLEKNFKYCQNRLKRSFLDMFLTILYDVSSPSGNV